MKTVTIVTTLFESTWAIVGVYTNLKKAVEQCKYRNIDASYITVYRSITNNTYYNWTNNEHNYKIEQRQVE